MHSACADASWQMSGLGPAQTGAEMFSAQISIGIPASAHISSLREDFLEFCDTLNLDAILEPLKG